MCAMIQGLQTSPNEASETVRFAGADWVVIPVGTQEWKAARRALLGWRPHAWSAPVQLPREEQAVTMTARSTGTGLLHSLVTG